MEIKQDTWKIKELVKKRQTINLNPTWQRGPTWTYPRQVLLIDSILRGMDIPKIYLRKLDAPNSHFYDAVDGQQRIRAIYEFQRGSFALNYPESLPSIGNFKVAGKKYAELHRDLQIKFNNFEVSVAEIISATNDEITNLFSRLQMGVSLNPAELRNAMQGPMRHVIDAIATSHDFFAESKIPDTRYKRQDYISLLFAIALNNGATDIKAPDLKKMVADFSSADKTSQVLRLSEIVGDALELLKGVDKKLKRRITQKWLFVDLCWLIMQNQAKGKQINVDELAENFDLFEDLRREYTRRPEDLIELEKNFAAKPNKMNRHLYDYIMAFRAQGATHANLKIRNAALHAFCR